MNKKPKKEVQIRQNITLCERLTKKATKIGKGNKSRGIREALERYK